MVEKKRSVLTKIQLHKLFYSCLSVLMFSLKMPARPPRIFVLDAYVRFY